MFTSAQTAKSSSQDMAAKSKEDKFTAIERAAEQRKKEEQELEAEKKKLAQQQAKVDNLLDLAQQLAQGELQPAAVRFCCVCFVLVLIAECVNRVLP